MTGDMKYIYLRSHPLMTLSTEQKPKEIGTATSRQNVNMLLNELRSSGMLRYNRTHIELNNPIVWN